MSPDIADLGQQHSCQFTTNSGDDFDTWELNRCNLHDNVYVEQSTSVGGVRKASRMSPHMSPLCMLESHRQRRTSTRLLEAFRFCCVSPEGLRIVANLKSWLERAQIGTAIGAWAVITRQQNGAMLFYCHCGEARMPRNNVPGATEARRLLVLQHAQHAQSCYAKVLQ